MKRRTSLPAIFALSCAPALLAMYHSQQELAWMRNIVEDVESALEQAGLRSRLATPPAVCFLDLSGYTRLIEERGDEAAADLASTLAGLVHRTSGDHGGRAVKWLGDGVMFVFKDPGGAVMGVGRYDLTRPSRDGGRDAVGFYTLGPLEDSIELDFALEAKCFAPTTPVGVKA